MTSGLYRTTNLSFPCIVKACKESVRRRILAHLFVTCRILRSVCLVRRITAVHPAFGGFTRLLWRRSFAFLEPSCGELPVRCKRRRLAVPTAPHRAWSFRSMAPLSKVQQRQVCTRQLATAGRLPLACEVVESRWTADDRGLSQGHTAADPEHHAEL